VQTKKLVEKSRNSKTSFNKLTAKKKRAPNKTLTHEKPNLKPTTQSFQRVPQTHNNSEKNHSNPTNSILSTTPAA
jgi:hypothetical protein